MKIEAKQRLESAEITASAMSAFIKALGMAELPPKVARKFRAVDAPMYQATKLSPELIAAFTKVFTKYFGAPGKDSGISTWSIPGKGTCTVEPKTGTVKIINSGK